MKSARSLRELFCFPGFVAAATLMGEFGDPKARIIRLRRRKKRPCARTVATAAITVTTSASAVRATWAWPAGGYPWSSNVGASIAQVAAACT